MGIYRQKDSNEDVQKLFRGKGRSQKEFRSHHLLSIYCVLGTILGTGFSEMPKIQRSMKSSHSNGQITMKLATIAWSGFSGVNKLL